MEQTSTILERAPLAMTVPMDFRVRLVHAGSSQRIVLVRAFQGERCVGSALGEAASAEDAEDRAIDRLRQRLRSAPAPSTSPGGPGPAEATASPAGPRPGANPPSQRPPGETPKGPEGADQEPPVDPEDWSADLMAVDQLLRHLGWGREEERVYMHRLFGHPSRSKLTRYADLMVLRRALESLLPGSDPMHAPLPVLRSELLTQCDGLLTQLGWTTERARQSLESHFAVTSRQHLTDDQLLAFNLLLEGALLGVSLPG